MRRNSLVSGRLFLALALLLPGCDARPAYLHVDAREKRLDDVGVESLDPTGAAPRAGVRLLRRIEVEPLDSREIGADTLSDEFHVFIHRCATCHEAPAPGQRTARRWQAAIGRMEANIRDTGLLRLTDEERQAILSFLQRHSADR